MKELSDTVIKQYQNITLYNDKLEIGDKSIALTKKEFQIMSTLMDSPEKVVSREELYNKAWPGVIVIEGAANVHISKLKKKLEEYSNIIKTANRRGYMLTLDPEREILSPIEQKITEYIQSLAEMPTPKMIKAEMEKFGYSKETTNVMLCHLRNKLNGKKAPDKLASLFLKNLP